MRLTELEQLQPWFMGRVSNHAVDTTSSCAAVSTVSTAVSTVVPIAPIAAAIPSIATSTAASAASVPVSATSSAIDLQHSVRWPLPRAHFQTRMSCELQPAQLSQSRHRPALRRRWRVRHI